MRIGSKVALWAMAAVGVLSTGALGQVINETEPNDSLAQADAVTPVTARTFIRGAITPTGDLDIYKVVVTTAGAWRFEVFDPTGADCTAALIPAAVRLAVLDPAGTVIKADPGTSGIGLCPEVSMYLEAGTYYVRVDKTAAGTIAEYLLECRPLTNLGTETEPNETGPTATPLIATSGYIFGGHLVLADSDFFSFAVPAGASVRLEVIEGENAVETCESNGVDSFLTLFSPTGIQLVTDDDEGRGFCSMIDGAGLTPLDAGAHGLAAGTYFAQVKASTLASATGGQFNYRRVVMVFTGTGACCSAAGDCTITAPGSCAGTFQVSSSVCSPTPCTAPPVLPGACCNTGTGGCAVVEVATCTTLGGQFRGGSTSCVPNQCVAGTGACCTSTACTQATSAACAGSGQVFQGVGSVCVAKVTCCPANFNRNATLEIQDIFDFLNAWFAGCP